jgi:LCP family protein required for cell wall assembly
MNPKLTLRGWLLVGLALLSAIAAYLGYEQARKFFLTYNVTPLEGFAVLNTPEANNTPQAGVESTQGALPAPAGPTPQPWDGASPVTLLVMGVDYGDWSADRNGPSRTDTMILFKVDPLTHSAGILNIPRDLWVTIPGFDYAKINTAFYLGEAARLPGGGPELARKTVENFLGVPIDYYAQIDFSAFEKFIDTIGGIEIDVPAEIKVDPIGEHNTVVLQPGKQMLTGPVALAYARARYTEGGDFDRANRQKDVILAIRKQVADPKRFLELISKAPQIYQDLAPGIHTNLTFEQAVQLAWLVLDIPEENIRRGAIAPPEAVLFAKSPDGTQDILKPVTDKIRAIRDEVFGANAAFKPSSTTASVPELLAAEAARISVNNGTGVEGLASRTEEYLKSQGLNVAAVGNANELPASTRIISYTGKPYTMKFLVDLMKISPYQIYYRYNPASEIDIELILGADWAQNNPMP